MILLLPFCLSLLSSLLIYLLCHGHPWEGTIYCLSCIDGHFLGVSTSYHPHYLLPSSDVYVLIKLYQTLGDQRAPDLVIFFRSVNFDPSCFGDLISQTMDKDDLNSLKIIQPLLKDPISQIMVKDDLNSLNILLELAAQALHRDISEVARQGGNYQGITFPGLAILFQARNILNWLLEGPERKTAISYLLFEICKPGNCLDAVIRAGRLKEFKRLARHVVAAHALQPHHGIRPRGCWTMHRSHLITICYYGSVDFLDKAIEFSADLTQIRDNDPFITVLDAALQNPALTFLETLFQRLQGIPGTDMTVYTGYQDVEGRPLLL
ncbi:uncharacterized protein P174DRAFT_435579 [Aspergillus novofumigatus IBT 16806]|uniref:Uncharacterized protein n=1 Tax=Aspergillus novofumigatus (strain IBT 16806) TaxID=1392255 RepID=A0A2I1BU30_ASPN1|nr:uncharacterized protein P174DRAFT_435579 [Aspergillus novofumigatus IBT 16806]PKX88852.1 hypothetical protein P174DRAFT_435579 [Aspergillus novofumigatus IBT 16806]